VNLISNVDFFSENVKKVRKVQEWFPLINTMMMHEQNVVELE